MTDSSTEEMRPGVLPWMRGILLLATGYNLLWGIFISQFPDSFYQWVRGLDTEAPMLVTYQGYGVLVMAAVYLACTLYPAKLWYLVGLGALSKVLGALWFWWVIMEQTVTKKFYFHLIFNDLVWVPVLIAILLKARQVAQYNKANPLTE